MHLQNRTQSPSKHACLVPTRCAQQVDYSTGRDRIDGKEVVEVKGMFTKPAKSTCQPFVANNKSGATNTLVTPVCGIGV